MGRGARLRKLALAGLAGWLTGAVLTTPFQVIELVRNSEGDARLLADSLGLGLILFAIWTLAMALTGLVLTGLPIAIWGKPAWLVQRRRLVVALSAVAAIVLTLGKFRVWEPGKPESINDTPLLAIYGLFALIFASVTAWLYLRMLAFTGPESNSPPPPAAPPA